MFDKVVNCHGDDIYTYVKGWHDLAEFAAHMQQWHGLEEPPVGYCKHVYIHKGVGFTEDGPRGNVIYEHDSPGRGRFKATRYCDVLPAFDETDAHAGEKGE
jgi:hypothetical protein